MGFDAKHLEADMSSPEIDEAIERNLALARTLGINATPTFVIGEKIVPGAISLKKLKRLIATARDIGGSVCVGFGVTLDASPLRAWRIVRCLVVPSMRCAQERNLQICGTYRR